MKRLIIFTLILSLLVLGVTIVTGASDKDILAIKKEILKNPGDAIPYLQ